LHLVNLLVGVLEGQLEMKSEPYKGSIFTILLPTEKPDSANDEVDFMVNNHLMSGDERIINAASIEFSDIYFD
jgi:hypothetical protein